MLKRFIYTFCAGLLFANGLIAQDSSKNVFTASVNYQSLLHYFGRVDSLKSSGIFPIIGFKSRSGLYVNTTLIFVKNSAINLNYAGTLLEGGYRLPDNKKITGNIYYSRFLYNSNTTLKQAAVKSQAGINTIFNNKIINLNLNGDIKFSPNNTDFGIGAGLDKMIFFRNLIDKCVLAIDPSAYVNAGTQNFTNTIKNNGPLGLPGTTYSTEQYKQLSILSFELSMPIVLVRGKFNAYVSPSFVSPQHLITVAGRPDLSETGQNAFYFSTGIGIRL